MNSKVPQVQKLEPLKVVPFTSKAKISGHKIPENIRAKYISVERDIT
jgi:hypothetical protein